MASCLFLLLKSRTKESFLDSLIKSGEFIKGMERLLAIRIFHNTVNKIEFLFWAELFRLCGVFVGETLLSDRVEPGHDGWDRQVTDDKCFSLFLCVGSEGQLSEMEKTCLPEGKPVYYLEDLYSTQELSEIPKGKGKKWPQEGVKQEALLTLMKEILEKVSEPVETAMRENGFKEEEINNFICDLQKLSVIYLKYDLLLYSMDLQFYRFDNEVMDDVEKKYYLAYKEIQELLSLHGDSSTLMYAKLFCAYKANEAARFRGRLERVDQEMVIEQTKKLIHDYPDFVNARVLLGLVYSGDKLYAWDAIQSFQDALARLGNVCFASHIYYWMALQLELALDNPDKAEKYYKYAYNSKKKYRNMYKRGFLLNKKEDYQGAVGFFEELLERLSIRFEKKFADPLEMEYCFITCIKLGDIFYSQFKDYEKAIQYYKKAIEEVFGNKDVKMENKKDNMLPDSAFFNSFYGRNAEKYKELIKRRMNLEIVYKKLRQIYQDLQRKEEVDYYASLLKP